VKIHVAKITQKSPSAHYHTTFKSNQIKSNLFANTKYERKKTDRKPEVKQNVKNNDKLEC